MIYNARVIGQSNVSLILLGQFVTIQLLKYICLINKYTIVQCSFNAIISLDATNYYKTK